MILVNTDLWSNFLAMLNKKITPITYNTWFKPLKLQELDQKNNQIIIQVPMQIHKKMLESNWYDLMVSTLNELTGITYEIKFVLESDIKEKVEVVDNIEVINNNDNKFETNLKKE